MPSRQMGMSIGSRHAREQCVHQGCEEQPDSSPEILKGQSVQITSSFVRLGYAVTIPVWPALTMKMQKFLLKPF